MEDTEVLKEVFIKEVGEILGKLESDLVSLEERWDQELVNGIFRYVHTLKGSSGIAGYKSIYEFTHRLENLLDKVRGGSIKATEQLIDILLESIDWVKDSIAGEDEKSLEMRKSLLLKKVDEQIGAPREKEGGATAETGEQRDLTEKDVGYRYFKIIAVFREDIFESGIDPLMILEDLCALGVVEERKVDRRRLPEFTLMHPDRCYLSWEILLKTKAPISKIEDIFIFVKDDNDIVVQDVSDQYVVEGKVDELEEKRIGEILVSKGILTENELERVLSTQDGERKKIGDIVVDKGYATEKDVQYALGEQEKIKKRVETSTVRVDTSKLDNLLNLLGEIVIGQAGITRIADELEQEKGFRLKNALYGLDRITREFQEQIMSIRMIPIGPTFEQFRRFVRDTAHTMGKEIQLEVTGGETELDKTVIEKIDDPLKHMIRNAIDHGIESPEEREAAGKPRKGKVTLKAYHQEGNVYIEVIDDGRGLDKTRIRRKAESMGIIKAGEDVPENRLLSFLFLPAFSTAEKVGELSGRGVGMDVVKTNVEALRGSVDIETKNGKGTVFRIKLPLTLAIIEGMMVRVGSSVYILPLLSIVESLRPKREDVKTVKEKGEVILVRNEYVTLVRLYELFGIEPEFKNPWESLVVVVEAAASRVGIMIDELMGQQQIVIKSLENYISNTRALSGAAILGDGRVALIIDVHGLVEEISK